MRFEFQLDFDNVYALCVVRADKPVFLSTMEGDPVNLYVFQSDSVNLSCHNSAEPAANMTWSFNGTTFTNPTDHYIVRIFARHAPYRIDRATLFSAVDGTSRLYGKRNRSARDTNAIASTGGPCTAVHGAA